MKRRLSTLMVFAAALLFVARTASSWSNATCCQRLVTLFESHVHPDLPLDKFAAGQMGIIEPTWDHSYLYFAYREMNGPGFDTSGQKAMLSLWNEWLELEPLPADAPADESNYPAGSLESSVRHEGIVMTDATSEWLNARGKVPDIGPIEGIGVDSSKSAFASFANCNVSSFRTAAATLDAMIAKFGLTSQQVKQWVYAQDQVFDNCSDGAPEYGVNDAAWPAMVNEWTTARSKVLNLEASSTRFSNNCPGMMFRNAALELDAMIEKEGASSPEVRQRVESEDKALDACSSRSGRGTGPTTPQIPAPLSEGTPFERAQRNYQIAAATFYSGDYDGAVKLFDAIGADASSPWRQLAPFLATRAMVRKATVSADANDQTLLAQAETRLQKIVADAPNETVKRYAKQVLGFVETQLHPEQRERELAHAVMQPTSADVLKQDVRDYVWMLDHRNLKPSADDDDLTAWISTFGPNPNNNLPAPGDPIAKWKATSSLRWLVAAISGVDASSPDTLALMTAAEKVKSDSPAFVTVNFHLARLEIEQAKGDAARARLDALLAMRDRLPISTVNQLKRMRTRVARNLTELLAYLPRTPLGFTDTGDADEIPSSLLDTPTPTGTPSPEPTVAVFETGPSPREAGRWGEGSTVSGGSGGSLGLVPRGFAIPGASPIPATTPAPAPDPLDVLAKEQLLDDDGAPVLTRGLPLTLLVEAAHSKALPPNLRAQVALTTFIRAILLNDVGAAKRLAPSVMDSNPKLKPSIEGWLTAKNTDERNFAAAYMMLQNPGMRFDLESGAGRVTPIDEVDEFRDNWWPSWGNPESPILPDFLSQSETKSAVDEWQKLSAINAPNLLCNAAIDHTRSDPDDPRAPEALYRCLTAVHLGCSNERGTELAKSAFQLLHRRYAKSEWADRGHVWFKGDGCGGN